MQPLTVKGERFDFVNSPNLRFKHASKQTIKQLKQRNKHVFSSVYLGKIVFERTIVTCLLLDFTAISSYSLKA